MPLHDVIQRINQLLNYGVDRKLIRPADTAYIANRIMEKLQLGVFSPCNVEPILYPAQALSPLYEYASSKPETAEKFHDAEHFSAEIMDCFTPRPSEVQAAFSSKYLDCPQSATDYFYALCKDNNYIQTDKIARDKKWLATSPYGDLIITINLSKPEKDPKAIAAAKSAPPAEYPKCALCRENEGFTGSANQAPRANHRIIPIKLGENTWFLQYSPYLYYTEHCILIHEMHKPMRINRKTFENLLFFTQLLPHYFVGSNADLPIVGGSILSHEHFQGGRFVFPMEQANIREDIAFLGYPDIAAGIVNWPMSVIRLRGANPSRLVDLSERILHAWRNYSDPEADIFAFSGETPHNTITPIARRRGDDYELDLVLRNNRTSDEHPLGIFHPHQEYHHIKKENIGLIEVMGLAILPPRLLAELDKLQKALEKPDLAEEIFCDAEMAKHYPWFLTLREKNLKTETIRLFIEQDIGRRFAEILANAGVFKDDERGKCAMRRFCAAIICE